MENELKLLRSQLEIVDSAVSSLISRVTNLESEMQTLRKTDDIKIISSHERKETRLRYSLEELLQRSKKAAAACKDPDKEKWEEKKEEDLK